MIQPQRSPIFWKGLFLRKKNGASVEKLIFNRQRNKALVSLEIYQNPKFARGYDLVLARETTNTPGFASATMNFRLEDAGTTACTLTTESRVYATDASTRRRFALYWRAIYPGSALIRRMWLRAIARR